MRGVLLFCSISMFLFPSVNHAQTSKPISWLPPAKVFAKPKVLTTKQANNVFKLLSNQMCIPLAQLKFDDGCVSRAHAMWGVLNKKGIHSQKIWAIPRNPGEKLSFLKDGKLVRFWSRKANLVKTAKGLFVKDQELSKSPLSVKDWKKAMCFDVSKHQTTMTGKDITVSTRSANHELWFWKDGGYVPFHNRTASLLKVSSGFLVVDPEVNRQPLSIKDWKEAIRFHSQKHNLTIEGKKIHVFPKKSGGKPLLRVYRSGKAVHWGNHVALLITTNNGHLVIDPSTNVKPVTIQEWKRNIHFNPSIHRIVIVSGRRYCSPNEKGTEKPDPTSYNKYCPLFDDHFKVTKGNLRSERKDSGAETLALSKVCK